MLGFLADKFGRLNTLILCVIMGSFAALGLWLPSTIIGSSGVSQGLFITFAMLYGCFAGAYVSLFPTSLVELFGVQNFTSVNGFLYMVRGFGTLFGTPLAGSFIHRGANVMGVSMGYGKTSIFVGVAMFAAAIAISVARLEAAGLSRWKA